MRRGNAILFAVLAAVTSTAAGAQTRPARTGAAETTLAPAQYSLLGGETVPAGADVVSAEFGWPSVTFGFTHGTGANSDVGLRFDLLYGVEETTTFSKFGVGARVPLRFVALRRDRLSVLLHFDPGIKAYTYSPAWFGIQFPLGLVFGYRATSSVTLAFGIDVPMTLFVTPSPVVFWIAPTFGPGVEAQITRNFLLGLNTRFGPVIRTGVPGVPSFFNDSGAEFGFLLQVLLAYRL